MSQEAIKKYDIPIDHLDYKYVEKCNDVKELEKIYKVLLTGEEGKYPDLENTVEAKIRLINPNSRVLRKDVPIVNKREIPKNEQAKLDEEINEFVKSIPDLAKEISKNRLQSDDNEEVTSNLPPIRNVKDSILIKGANKDSASVKPEASKKTQTTNAKKSAKPKDYREWEKIEKQLDKEEGEEKVEEKKPVEKKVIFDESSVNSEKNKLLKTLPKNAPAVEDENLKSIKAEQEKCKGNESFNSKSYEEAVVYYTRSIQLLENAAAFNNRALAYLKLEKWDKVIEDCNSVFKYEKDNVKALLRRSTAYFNKKRLNEAVNDIEIVVSKEPTNKKALELRDDIKKALKREKDEAEQIKAKGGKRLTIEETDGDSKSEEEEEEEQKAPVITKKSIQIKEVENDDEDEEDEQTKPPVETPKPAEPVIVEKPIEVKIETPVKIEEKPLPSKVVEFKDRANKEYSNGQYGEAINYYSKAIDQLQKEFKREDLKLYYANTLSVLYSNRAASKQKNGEFKDAINDCNLSLEINDGNIKVIFKKAHLLELSEKYNDSLLEYQKIMRLDSTYRQAQEGYNRVKNLLISRGEFKSERSPKIKVEPQAPATPTESFDQIKKKGNEYFIQSNYGEALKYYTKCVDLDKENIVAYLNRSICLIKLNDWFNALNDCNFVLKHDIKNVKALYRRAIANRYLGNLSNSIRDLKELIGIEPKNTIAIKDLAEIEKQLKEAAAKIEETKKEESKQTPKENVLKEEAPKVETLKRKPVKFENEITNNYEFLQAWNSVRPDDISTFCQLIEKIDAQKLAKYVGSKLDDNMLSTFVKTFHRYIFDDANEEYEQTEDVDGFNLIDRKQKLNKLEIYSYLLQLTKVQRFDIIKLFLNAENKIILNKCFDYFNQQLALNANSSNCSFNKEDILKLKTLYGA